MVMRYAGTELVVPPEDLREQIADLIDPSWLTEWTDRTWPGHRQEHLSWEGYRPRQPNRIGVLSWPRGAARFAYGHFLADHEGVATIRAAIASNYTAYDADFEIHDGIREVKTKLFCLPPRPLDRVSRANGSALYLLTLVDDRYRWWWKTANITVTAGTTIWEDLYSQIGTALGVTITASAISADYLLPDAILANKYRSLPVLLDAVAACVGHRIVRKLDGTVHAMSADASLLAHNASLAREDGPLTDTNDRLAGHELDLLVGV